jgi:hypothetical protein
MSGNEIKTEVYIPGKGKQARGVAQYPAGRMMTLEVITDWIRLQGLDEYTTNGLIEIAGRYPTQALPHFRRNFNLMIARVRAKRQEEQNPPVDETTEDWATDIPMEDLVIAEEENENGES